MVIVLIVVVVVLVLRAARDNKLGRFKFSISASLLKLCTFGNEVESQREWSGMRRAVLAMLADARVSGADSLGRGRGRRAPPAGTSGAM
jgi:hypothetical protein